MGLSLALVLGLVLVVLWPEAALLLELVALPLAVAGAVVGALYLRRLYVRQRRPRSVFFGMLVEMKSATAALGLWVGYLALGRISGLLHDAGILAGEIPVPEPRVSTPISGLVITVLVLPGAIYALRIYLFRRRATFEELPTTETDLDRRV